MYVHLKEAFSYEAWVRGLNEGRSFVTTGPMLFVQVNGRDPGSVFKSADTFQLTGTARSALPALELNVPPANSSFVPAGRAKVPVFTPPPASLSTPLWISTVA